LQAFLASFFSWVLAETDNYERTSTAPFFGFLVETNDCDLPSTAAVVSALQIGHELHLCWKRSNLGAAAASFMAAPQRKRVSTCAAGAMMRARRTD
jgi:hypothetical protein